MKKLLFLIFTLLASVSMKAQSVGKWQVDWHADARMAGSTGQYMPFWARTGEDGILPVRSSGLLVAGADISYRNHNGIFFEAGTNLAGALSLKSPLNTSPVYGFVDRLYVSGGWRMLRADIGLKPRRGELGPLSVTGGDIIMSGNARNLPGINLSSDWIYFEKGHWFGLRGNLAHYHMTDARTVNGTMVHDKSVAAKIALGRKVDIVAGFHHYAQWGGEGEGRGAQTDPW